MAQRVRSMRNGWPRCDLRTRLFQLVGTTPMDIRILRFFRPTQGNVLESCGRIKMEESGSQPDCHLPHSLFGQPEMEYCNRPLSHRVFGVVSMPTGVACGDGFWRSRYLNIKVGKRLYIQGHP